MPLIYLKCPGCDLVPYSILSFRWWQQVLEILSHVNKRVKNYPEISLPFSELWRIYNEANASPMVRNFCIVYIEMAFERLPIQV